MDPVTLGGAAAAVVAVIVVLVLASVGWWLFRKTLSVMKTLLMVSVVGLLVLLASGVGVWFVMMR